MPKNVITVLDAAGNMRYAYVITVLDIREHEHHLFSIVC
jgi:hypothetical protein